MRDLTEGSIPKHLLGLATPMAIGMVFQTLYYLVDLYFVAQLGEAAIAGVGTAGNIQFIVIALSQVLGVGTMATIAHAVGKKDRGQARLLFNQAVGLAAVCAAAMLAGYAAIGPYMRSLGADAATTQAGVDYLRWYLPGMALQFATVAMGSALRGTGIEKPSMVVQMLAVTLNAILSPILIQGWLTGHPLGVRGAALASTLSVLFGVVLMTLYFLRLETYVGFARGMLRPRLAEWRRILSIGLPPGGEFGLLFIYIGVIYWVTRDFGAAAQAGFGIGSRVMQAIFLPAMAIAFSTAPVAGQNYGAGRIDRVRETFVSAVVMGSTLMFAVTLFCQWRPEALVTVFTQDPEVVRIGADFLRITSWNFVASGLIFTCGGLLQAFGNTLPSLLASSTRFLTFVLPAVWMSQVADFELHHLWYLSVASVGLQALTNLWLLRRVYRRRAAALASPPPDPEGPETTPAVG
ncbi:MAG: MATE family efflux transporter [Acidobacteriota bacterium]